MKTKHLIPLLLIILVFIIGEFIISIDLYFPNTIKYFFRGILKYDLLSALATFVVGTIAILLYVKQRKDQKRDAANVIIAEIRQAERLIDQFKKRGVSNDILFKILPSNNWKKYNYLFINDLDQDEIEQINNFYSQCLVLDNAIDQINISHDLKYKSIAIHKNISLIAKESLGNKEVFELNKTNFLKLIESDSYTFHAGAPAKSIATALNNINLITTSTIGAKLKSIAQIK